MRIIHKQKIKKFVGIFRSRSGFLFLPKRIGNETRWLEYAKWTDEYQITIGSPYKKHGWVSHYWL